MSQRQLQLLKEIDTLFSENQIDYWLFGGWSIDFYYGKQRREHKDLDVMVWESDKNRVEILLRNNKFINTIPIRNRHGEYNAKFAKDEVQVDIIFLRHNNKDQVVTPGRWENWPYPEGSFEKKRYKIGDISVIVVSPICMVETYVNFAAMAPDISLAEKHMRDFEDLKRILTVANKELP